MWPENTNAEALQLVQEINIILLYYYLLEEIWSCIPDLPEGETLATLKGLSRKLKGALQKKPKDVKLHKDYLDHTFALRRREILEKPSPVESILKDWPSLRNFVHVSKLVM
jgi:hypothetical protein